MRNNIYNCPPDYEIGKPKVTLDHLYFYDTENDLALETRSPYEGQFIEKKVYFFTEEDQTLAESNNISPKNENAHSENTNPNPTVSGVFFVKDSNYSYNSNTSLNDQNEIVYDKFRQEYEIACTLGLAIPDSFREKNEYMSFQMHYCGEDTLESYCKEFPLKNNALAIKEQYQKLLISIIKEIDRLHQQGIIHGDIKPSNFTISLSFETKVIDTGSACYIDDKEDDFGKKLPTYTPSYINSAENYTPSVTADKFALAVTCSELLWDILRSNNSLFSTINTDSEKNRVIGKIVKEIATYNEETEKYSYKNKEYTSNCIRTIAHQRLIETRLKDKMLQNYVNETITPLIQDLLENTISLQEALERLKIDKSVGFRFFPLPTKSVNEFESESIQRNDENSLNTPPLKRRDSQLSTNYSSIFSSTRDNISEDEDRLTPRN